MKKIIIICTFLIISLNTSLIADEKKCKKFSIGCKVNKIISDTKKFQKEKWSESKEQLKNTIPKNLPFKKK